MIRNRIALHFGGPSIHLGFLDLYPLLARILGGLSLEFEEYRQGVRFALKIWLDLAAERTSLNPR